MARASAKFCQPAQLRLPWCSACEGSKSFRLVSPAALLTRLCCAGWKVSAAAEAPLRLPCVESSSRESYCPQGFSFRRDSFYHNNWYDEHLVSPCPRSSPYRLRKLLFHRRWRRMRASQVDDKCRRGSLRSADDPSKDEQKHHIQPEIAIANESAGRGHRGNKQTPDAVRATVLIQEQQCRESRCWRRHGWANCEPSGRSPLRDRKAAGS